jgi:hypothetical protein
MPWYLQKRKKKKKRGKGKKDAWGKTAKQSKLGKAFIDIQLLRG